MTTTWSPFLILTRLEPFVAIVLNHLRRERNDLHEVPVAKLAGDGPEDARADGRVVGLDEHARVLVEADVGAVLAADVLHRADDDGVVHRPLLHRPVGARLLDRHLDLVAEGGPRRL